MRLLLVEDDPAVGRLVARNIQREGIEVARATTVAAGVQLYAERRAGVSGQLPAGSYAGTMTRTVA